MEKIQKDINDWNKEVVRDLTNLYNKVSASIDKSYYLGQKSGYEEILAWLKQPQNKSQRFIPPKKMNTFLIEKGMKSKNTINSQSLNKSFNYKEDSKKKPNKINFNYAFYNQTFNYDNNNNNNNNNSQNNVFPTSVESLFSNNKNIFNNETYNNGNIINTGSNFNVETFGNNNLIISNINSNNFSDNINNNINKNNYCFSNSISNNDSQDESMKPNSPKLNIFNGNVSLKKRKK